MKLRIDLTACNEKKNTKLKTEQNIVSDIKFLRPGSVIFTLGFALMSQ